MTALHNLWKAVRGKLITSLKIRRSSVIALLATAGIGAFVAACSTQFFYDRIDAYIVWQVDSYVSLDKAQKAELKRRTAEYLDTVRLDELPRAGALLAVVRDEVRSGSVTPAMIDRRFQDMLAMTEELMTGIVPTSEWLLQSLSAEQVQELAESLNTLNDEMYEDYSGSTEDERRDARNKSSVRAIQRFTGRLTDAQKGLVTDALQRMTDSSEQWIAYQRDWQQRFIALLTNPPAEAEFREKLTVLFVYPRSFHAPEYRAAVEANRAILNTMLAELFNGLSDRQRKKATDTLDDYIKTLNRLSATADY